MRDRRQSVIPEASVITDFAITTVNVPDRLDAQEVYDRAEEAGESPRVGRIDGRDVRRWLYRGLVALVVIALGFLSFLAVAPLRNQVSAEGIAARLTEALGKPVSVANAEVQLSPIPRLVVEGIAVADEFSLGQVSIRFSWATLAKAMQGGGWVWGHATVEPLELTADAALAAVRAIPALSRAVPATIPSVRFESVAFSGSSLLPGRYEVVAQRHVDGSFSKIKLVEIGANGNMETNISIARGAPASFHLNALQWRPPIGPAMQWNQVAATGSFEPGRLRIDSFSANGFFGVLTGNLVGVKATGWTVQGAFQVTNFDLVAVQRELRVRAKFGDPKSSMPLQGILDAAGTLSGRGAALGEAIDRISAAGKAQVRLAALNGINLGAAAVQGNSGTGQGGSTRFADLDASFSVAGGATNVHSILGQAGALQVRGAFGIEPSLAIGGILRAEIAAARGQMPVDIRVSGTLLEPTFEN